MKLTNLLSTAFVAAVTMVGSASAAIDPVFANMAPLQLKRAATALNAQVNAHAHAAPLEAHKAALAGELNAYALAKHTNNFQPFFDMVRTRLISQIDTLIGNIRANDGQFLSANAQVEFANAGIADLTREAFKARLQAVVNDVALPAAAVLPLPVDDTFLENGRYYNALLVLVHDALNAFFQVLVPGFALNHEILFTNAAVIVDGNNGRPASVTYNDFTGAILDTVK